jgi:hypothetical protein
MSIMRDLPDINKLLDLIEGNSSASERCRAIAERERRQGWAPYAAFEEEFARLLGEAVGPGLLARLAAEIRRGRFDAPGPERTRLEALLWQLVRQRLSENNPEFSL